jgi:hypothetical protein
LITFLHYQFGRLSGRVDSIIDRQDFRSLLRKTHTCCPAVAKPSPGDFPAPMTIQILSFKRITNSPAVQCKATGAPFEFPFS